MAERAEQHTPAMKIDAHQHFWKYHRAQYPWMTDALAVLRTDYLPPDLEGIQWPLGFAGSVAVQARQSLEESRWLLQLADQFPRIMGVVGWVDLRAPNVAETLAILAEHPRFVGVRHVVQDEPDAGFMLRPEFLRGIACLQEFDLTYDLLIYARQLPAAIRLVRTFPGIRFVLDHLAKPEIRGDRLSPWKQQIQELAESPNVYCKLSGMVTEADWAHWRYEDFLPYLDAAVASFGIERLMFGSDWPVCLLAANYEKVFSLVDHYLKDASEKARARVLGENARDFYGLG